MSSWISFLHKLGSFVSDLDIRDGLRPSVVVSLPCLDYASVIIASGIITARFKKPSPLPRSLEKWGEHLGTAVCFPRIKVVDGDQNLYLSKGFVDSIDSHMGKERLLVKWVENGSLTQTCAIEGRWLPLVFPIDATPVLERKKPGSVLARHVQSLEAILGESGLCSLIEKSHNTVCIVDTKNKVISEVKLRIPLSKFGLPDNLKLQLRDLVRLDIEGSEAMADSHCCRVSSEPEDRWPTTIISGSLRFLKHWDNCSSPTRVAIISPIETNYTAAVLFSDDLYKHRAPGDLMLPDEILREKPVSVDIQLMYSR